jgi:allantoicase
VSTPPPAGPAFLDLPELANERVGGAAIATNDDFFAQKENLLRVHEAQWRDDAYTDNGKWMDGWESRRRREPGYDWCVVRLGLPGAIHGVVVDTAFFRGNFPAECSLEACAVPGPLDLEQLKSAQWTELFPRSTLGGDRKNFFTHVRLNIFPDGGVARLRVHGAPLADPARVSAFGGLVDLAALENGAHVISCSDMFFGSRHNLIKPDRAVNMGDGWETRRRRGPGNDWSLVRLFAPGTVQRLEVDTTFFKGNAPGRCLLEGAYDPHALGEPNRPFRELVESPLQPHTRHFFDHQLRRLGPISHVKLSVFPDGGVARLRVWGELAAPPSPALDRLHALSPEAATAALLSCCGSKAWAAALAARRPFEDVPALLRQAERVWWEATPADWREAFAAHPRIGSASAPPREALEQAGTASAASQTLARLQELNARYVAAHGFIFIVCASGKSAEQMLALLEARVGRSTEDELQTAAEEQAQITALRLQRWLAESA